MNEGTRATGLQGGATPNERFDSFPFLPTLSLIKRGALKLERLSQTTNAIRCL